MQIIRVEDIDDPRVAAFRDVPDPVLVRRRGLFVAEGRFVLARLLASPRFHIQALLLTDTALAALRPTLTARSGDPVPVYVTTRELIRKIGGYQFHQGCLGLGLRPDPPACHEVLRDVADGQPVVVLERVGNADNVGGIFRNAAALGAGAVLLGPGCCDPLYRKAVRTSLGACLQVPFGTARDWPGGLGALRDRGYDVMALTPDPDAMPLRDYVLSPRAAGVAVLVGSEGDGLTARALASADVRVRIVMEPIVDSLNVATATAIALQHLRVIRSCPSTRSP